MKHFTSTFAFLGFFLSSVLAHAEGTLIACETFSGKPRNLQAVVQQTNSKSGYALLVARDQSPIHRFAVEHIKSSRTDVLIFGNVSKQVYLSLKSDGLQFMGKISGLFITEEVVFRCLSNK